MRNLSLLQKIIAGILIIIVVALAVVWTRLDATVESNIEQIASATLGTDTRIEKLRLGLIDGQMEIDEVNINNPKGFKTPYFMKAQQLELEIKPATLLGKIIEIQAFKVNAIDINIEQRFINNNLLEIWTNLQQQVERMERMREDKTDKKLKLTFNYITVKNVLANIILSPLDTNTKPLSFEISNLELKEITSDEFQAILTSEFINNLVSQILISIIEQGQNSFPNQLPEILIK
ncbi:MAG: hypothetical protein AB4368_19390 [Xenococcaceae cyanobacterium]